MVPMREIFEDIFSCSLEWNESDQTITAVYRYTPSRTIKMKIGDNTMYLNDQPVLIDVPPQIVSGKTLVPLKAITSSFGMGIGYDSERQIVVLGFAVDLDNVQNVIAIDAQNYTDIPLDEPVKQESRMYGDIDLLKLYTVASSNPEFMYELKGHPYESKYKVLFTVTKKGSIVSSHISIQDLKKPDMKQKVTWRNTDGKTYTHTIGVLYELFPLLQLANGNE